MGLNNKETIDYLKKYYDSISSIPEVVDTITKVKEFLNDCEIKELIKFPNLELADYFKKADSRAVFNVLNQSAQIRIIEKQNKEKFIPETEWIAFQKIYHIDSMRALAEELKVDLKAIIDHIKINPDVNELGTYLRQIYDKLGYASDKRKEMNKIFKVDLRNSLSHLDYELSNDAFIWSDAQGNHTMWTNEDLALPIQQMSVTTNVIYEKIKEIKSKSS